MSSKSETGHAINVANFEKLIAYCTTYSIYNPSNSLLTFTALNKKLLASKQVMTGVNAVTSPATVAINNRQLLFESVPQLATRVLAALSSSQITDRRIVADVQTITRKLQGRRATPKKKADPAAADQSVPANNSTSQKSFDNQVEFMDRLVKRLEAEPAYIPNETELTIQSLKAFVINLAKANKAVIDTQANYQNQLNNRQQILYAPVTGLVDTAKEVKNYVKSIFNASHPSFKQVNAIPFRTIKDRK